MTEPKQQTSCAGWTILTLKELLEKRFDHLDRIREAEAKSLVLQAAEYERRLDALNGEQDRISKIREEQCTRGELDRVERDNAELHRKQDALLLPRPEYTAQHDALAGEFHAAVDNFNLQIGTLKEWRAEIIPVLSQILAQLGEIGPLKDWRNEQKGKASQSAVVGAYILAIAGWLISPLIALAIERVMR